MSKYHMGNKDREILDEQTIYGILKKGKIITFALCDNNQPYAISMSYGYDKENQCIYVHCSKSGLKMEFIKKNPNVCATVIEDHGYKVNDCSQFYRSLVIWGKLKLVSELSEKKHGFKILFTHLEGENETMSTKMTGPDDDYNSVGMLKFEIEHIDAKGNV